jgi:outer membrane immunogenic protein
LAATPERRPLGTPARWAPELHAIPPSFWLSPAGFIGGAQAGYNWQADHFVIGVEADIQGSTQRDDKICLINCVPVIQSVSFDQRMNWLATVRGRVGYALGSTLFYATGGVAYGNVKTTIVTITPGTFNTDMVAETRTGFAVGGGIEYALDLFGLFGRNWTTKTEYLFVDLGGGDNQTLRNSGLIFSTKMQEHIFRMGLNYHFNAPVVAKY